jgi:hypothetical protein
LATALDQWMRREAGTLGAEARIVRGNRRKLVSDAAGPLRGQVDAAAFDKLAQSLSLIFGIEAIVVLKDIWGLDDDEARRVALWAAAALVGTAAAEAEGKGESGRKEAGAQAAARPRRKGAVRA